MEYEFINKMSEEYPKHLYDLSDAPNELYVMGNKKIMKDFGIAVVGARKCLGESEKIAAEISEELSLNGVNIISGLAHRN